MCSCRVIWLLWAMLIGAVYAPSASAWDWQTDECRHAVAGTAQWQNAPLIPMEAFKSTTQPHHMSISFSAVPDGANGDTLFGVSQGATTDWRGIAAIVRFNQNGTIDVRDGDVYRADTVMTYKGYSEGFLIRMDIDLDTHTYSVYATHDINFFSYNYEQLIAKDYRFRTEQQSVTTLDNFVVEAEINGLWGCQKQNYPVLIATPGPAQWQNAEFAYPIMGNSLYFRWKVKPLADNSDALLALSDGPQTTWTGLAAIVRFNAAGTVDVRNGDRYMADVVVPYVAGQTYWVGIMVHMQPGYPRTYSVAIAPEGGASQTIATYYAFRTEQQNIPSISNWTTEAEIGGLKATFMYRDSY